MSGKHTKINPKSSQRVIELITDFSITQKQLAEKACIHPNTVSNIVRGRSAMTDVIAQEIEKAFPSYCAEYLKGNVDYRNENEHLDNLITRHQEEHENNVDLLKRIASLRGFEIMLFYASAGVGVIDKDRYIVRNGDTQTQVTITEILEWLEDICDFTELKLRRALKRRNEYNG